MLDHNNTNAADMNTEFTQNEISSILIWVHPWLSCFSMQISVCGFQAGEQLLSLIVATLTASVAIGAGQIVANVVNTRAN